MARVFLILSLLLATGCTPAIYKSIDRGNLTKLEEQIQKKKKVTDRELLDRLFIKTQGMDGKKRADMLAMILDRGADTWDSDHTRYLVYLGSREMLDVALYRGLSPHAYAYSFNGMWNCPLVSLAARAYTGWDTAITSAGAREIFQRLLEVGADPNASCNLYTGTRKSPGVSGQLGEIYARSPGAREEINEIAGDLMRYKMFSERSFTRTYERELETMREERRAYNRQQERLAQAKQRRQAQRNAFIDGMLNTLQQTAAAMEAQNRGTYSPAPLYRGSSDSSSSSSSGSSSSSSTTGSSSSTASGSSSSKPDEPLTDCWGQPLGSSTSTDTSDGPGSKVCPN